MTRKFEYGAGVAAGVLAVATLLYLLFAPIVCSVAYDKAGNCPSKKYVTLAQAGPPAWFWLLVVVMIALLGAGAAAAIAEARFNRPRYAPVLWGASVVSLVACALTGGLGLIYLLGFLALAAAAYASLLPRIRARRVAMRPPAPTTPTGAIVESEPNPEPDAEPDA